MLLRCRGLALEDDGGSVERLAGSSWGLSNSTGCGRSPDVEEEEDLAGMDVN